MNYLAHAALSQFDEGLLIGNFIADHIRGNQYTQYSPQIIKGIYLHRSIDSFTDSHPDFKACKRFFYDGFEKYSGILVDIYFDYFLAQQFEQHYSLSLREFCDFSYAVYQKNKEQLPKSSQQFLHYVLQNDIYYNYSQIEGIERVLYHLSHRLKHGVFLNQSLSLFEKHKSELETHFNRFWAELKATDLISKD
jgi:acyl carrier protein phosphodiesterase